jgi:tRNA 2-thiocytidine biosynthesis protein TtcA
MPWAVRRTHLLVKRALDKFRLVPENDRVVVGVSGGSDSLCLLHALKYHNDRYRKHWDIVPVHIDPGYEGWNADRVARACERIGLPCTVKAIDVPGRLRKIGDDHCFFCARERRKTLFLTAHALDCRTVALGHHMDDVNETFLMNLLMASSGSTFMPRQELFHGDIILVRPLYYVEQPMIRDYLKQVGVRPVRNRCPYERRGTRLRLRRFLDRLYAGDRRIRTNLFWGMHNLKPQYLPGVDSPPDDPPAA